MKLVFSELNDLAMTALTSPNFLWITLCLSCQLEIVSRHLVPQGLSLSLVTAASDREHTLKRVQGGSPKRRHSVLWRNLQDRTSGS